MQDEFEKTSVNMSTYLVAFIVAEFTSLSQNVSETLVCPTQIGGCAFILFTHVFSGGWTCLIVTLCLGVCLLCAREKESHRLRSGYHI